MVRAARAWWRCRVAAEVGCGTRARGIGGCPARVRGGVRHRASMRCCSRLNAGCVSPLLMGLGAARVFKAKHHDVAVRDHSARLSHAQSLLAVRQNAVMPQPLRLRRPHRHLQHPSSPPPPLNHHPLQPATAVLPSERRAAVARLALAQGRSRHGRVTQTSCLTALAAF